MAKANPRKSNGARARELRARVLASEDTCSLCGGIVDKSIPAGHPMAPEVEHVVPISQGGAIYDRGNARLAHRSCNQRKGDGRRRGSVTLALIPTSQDW